MYVHFLLERALAENRNAINKDRILMHYLAYVFKINFIYLSIYYYILKDTVISSVHNSSNSVLERC
jgi:hypothetical protein